MIKQLAHLCFYSEKIEEIIEFYRDKLGLKIKFTLDNDAGVAFGFYFECGNNTFLEFFDYEHARKQWGDNADQLAATNIYKHFCLQVENIESFK